MSGGLRRGGSPLAVGCDFHTTTHRRGGIHELVSALQRRVQAGQSQGHQGCAACKGLECAFIRLPELRQVAIGWDRCDCDQGGHHQCAPGSESRFWLSEIGRWQGQAEASPSIAHTAACPSRGAAPVAVIRDSSAGRARSIRSASATSATCANVRAPRGVNPFSACSSVCAEVAWPLASTTTTSAIHPRRMVFVSSWLISGPRGNGWGGLATARGFGGRGEEIGPAGFQLPLPGIRDGLLFRPMEDRTTAHVEKAGKLGIRLQAEQRLNGGFGHVHRAAV